jgi:hypothetical protein
MTLMELTNREVAVINVRRNEIAKLKEDYEERLSMYYEGLTHAGDVIGRRKFLINLGEEIPEIILTGYKCPR